MNGTASGMTVAETVEWMLAEIDQTPKHNVHASRNGICAAVQRRRLDTLILRRVNGKVRLEVWVYKPGGNVKSCAHHQLPFHLECRAAQMLDNL